MNKRFYDMRVVKKGRSDTELGIVLLVFVALIIIGIAIK